MKRDFELELKELKQSEVPDLWSRIEACLPENLPKRRIAWGKWGILLAACLYLVILFPVIRVRVAHSPKENSTGIAESGSGSENGAADSAALNSAGELAGGQLLEEIAVQILEADISGEEVLYRVVVLEGDVDGILERDRQLWIVGNADSGYGFPHGREEDREDVALQVGEGYMVSLWYEDDVFWVVGVER